ncbi:MAG: hypothetical protein V4803_01675 [Burkholderia gladioli]|uniref:hypothetical protein n=1 Tax=Burkholderia gladioli TaxID=28095 RepID=UPI000F52775E|nr:hypothetical protein [Burkholderia gladioli]
MHDKTPRKSRFRGVFIDGALVEAGVIHEQEKEARAGARRQNIANDTAHAQANHPKSKKAEPLSNRTRPFLILERVAIDLDFQYLKLLATDSA